MKTRYILGTLILAVLVIVLVRKPKPKPINNNSLDILDRITGGSAEDTGTVSTGAGRVPSSDPTGGVKMPPVHWACPDGSASGVVSGDVFHGNIHEGGYGSSLSYLLDIQCGGYSGKAGEPAPTDRA